MKVNESGEMEFTPQTEFNSSVAQLYRIDAIEKHCRRSHFSKDYMGWYEGLTGLWIEISSEVLDKHYKEIQQRMEEIEQIICNNIKQDREGKRRFHPTLELKKVLVEFEILLRKLMKERGLGMKDKDDPRRAVIGGK